MPTVDVVDLKRQKVGSVDLPEEVFGCKPHSALVHEAVVMQRACERQGTASTLRRGEVAGPGKSHGSKSILGGRGQGRFALRYGVMADRCLGRSRVIIPTACRKRSTVQRFKARCRQS